MSQLTGQEEEMTIEILTFFFPDNPPTFANRKMAELASKMMQEALQKSNLMNMCPRPTLMPSLGWLVTQSFMAFWRSVGRQKIYETVRVGLAYNYQSIYQIAQLDL